MGDKYITYKDDNLEFIYHNKIYDIDDINPLLEQYRENILNKIQAKFKKIVKKYIDEKYIKGKHDADRILEAMMARYIMTLLSKENNSDPVIPNSSSDYTSLKEDLRVKLRKDKSIDKDKREHIINKIIKKLKLDELLNDGVNDIRAYYRLSKEYAKNKNKKVIKSRKNQYVSLNYDGDIVDVYDKLYHKMVNRYKGSSDYDLDMLAWCLIKRYIMLKSYTLQLAVHPNTMKELKKCYNIRFELFGSVLNTYHNKYCSLFYDIEKYFGSYGSFFSFKPIKGSYSMNPPFDDMLITHASERMIEALNKSKKQISIIIWIPVWDDKGKEYLAKHCVGYKKRPSGIFKGYPGLDVIENSKMLQYKKIVCLKDMSYFDYMWYRKRTAAHTYVLVIQNKGTFNKECIDGLDLKKK